MSDKEVGSYREVIRLKSVDDILRFIKDIGNIEGSLFYRIGYVEISARSLMNAFSLNLEEDITVTYLGKDVDLFIETMKNYK